MIMVGVVKKYEILRKKARFRERKPYSVCCSQNIYSKRGHGIIHKSLRILPSPMTIVIKSLSSAEDTEG